MTFPACVIQLTSAIIFHMIAKLRSVVELARVSPSISLIVIVETLPVAVRHFLSTSLYLELVKIEPFAKFLVQASLPEA